MRQTDAIITWSMTKLTK